MLPDDASVGAPDDTLFVPAAAAAAATAGAGAANGKTDDRTAVLAAATASPAAAASAAVASASPRGAVAAPPRVRIGAEQEAAPAATVAGAAGAAGAAGGTKVRRIGGHPESPSVSLPAFDDESVGGGRFSGAVLPLLVAGVAVAVIVAGLIVITNSGGSTNANITHNNTNAGTTGQNLHKKHTAAAPFSAAKVTVAVLNGTAQQGLAGDVGKKLSNYGYKRGNVTNAASQTQNLTFVYFMTGKANKIAAQHVAKALALPPSRVRHAGSGVVQSCTISATGASLGSCSANVIVSVGQDRVTLASSG
jgi:pyruvate/2-oxoglutarate dehydrogenase complex dihydrolipoamide acyltransferase (E2) component